MIPESVEPLWFRTIWISDPHLGTVGCQAEPTPEPLMRRVNTIASRDAQNASQAGICAANYPHFSAPQYRRSRLRQV